MQKTVPVVIAGSVGALIAVAFFSPPLLWMREKAEEWFTILAAIAMLLGGTNLCVHHLRKISDRAAGWGFSAVTLLTFFITVSVGVLKVGVVPESARNLNRAWSGGYLQEGGAFWWMFQYVYSPMMSTMFALLAFYVASAAFRAFRAKNFEAALLLVTAIIVLIGQTPDRDFLPEQLAFIRFETLTELCKTTFVTAGQRAIMIGIALGVAATSLRILLGLDRSYLGGDE